MIARWGRIYATPTRGAYYHTPYKFDRTNMTNKSDTSKRIFKAIMLDVDGTLVAHHPLAQPTPRVCKAVRRAQELGTLVSVATGRLVEGFEIINQSLQLKAPVVLEGGARLYDPVEKTDIWTAYLDASEARQIIIGWFRQGLPFGFNANGISYNSPSMFEMKKQEVRAMQAGEAEWMDSVLSGKVELTEKTLSLIDYDMVTHIISYPLTPTVAEGLRKSLHRFSCIDVSVNTTHYDDGWCVYLTHVLATKQHGIVEFAKHCGVSAHDIIGVGDQEIDYPLLMACGLKVAMGNAVQSLKDIADYVAPSVEEDGAAEVIERFLLGN